MIDHARQYAQLHDLVNCALTNLVAICPDRRLKASHRHETYRRCLQHLQHAESALRFITGRQTQRGPPSPGDPAWTEEAVNPPSFTLGPED